MARSKAFRFIIILTSLVFFLSGCASKPSKTGPDKVDFPISGNQNLKQVKFKHQKQSFHQMPKNNFIHIRLKRL